MKNILLFFLLIIALELRAQNAVKQINIKGIVVDLANGDPLSYATLILRDAITDAPVKSLLTKDDGSFEFVVLGNKAYQLSVVYVGYYQK